MLKKRKIVLIVVLAIVSTAFLSAPATCQTAAVLKSNLSDGSPEVNEKQVSTRMLYGQASYYASKFEGRKTATGEIFKQNQLTAACNVLPLGTWVRVTNLRNGKSVVVRTNDRLHVKTRRIVDLTKTGAQQLGYVSSGLTRVKVEVLNQKPYKKLR
jgi:rare lipoprotein A